MTRAALAALTALTALLAVGCPAAAVRPERRPALVPVPSLVRLVDAAERPAGLAVVVRVTTERVVLLAALGPAAARHVVLALGDERVPVDVEDGVAGPAPRGDDAPLDVAVIEAPRRPGLRPLGPAGRVQPGQRVTLVAAAGAAGPLTLTDLEVTEVAGGLVLLSPPPFADALDVRTAGRRAADARGAVALTADGALLGFVTAAHGERPVVTPLEALPALAAQVGRAPGRDVLVPGDEALTLRLEVVGVGASPTLPDDWGGPDLFVQLTLGEDDLPALPLEPGALGRPILVRAAAAGPVAARLVERDVTLADGEQDELLAGPVRFDALGPGEVRLAFRLLDAVVERHPEARAGPRVTRVTLRADRVDPDARSGDDRTPLGTLVHAVGLGRVATGALDAAGGDGTDFWGVDVAAPDAPAPVDALLVVFCRDPAAALAGDVFGPGLEAPLARLESRRGRRLVVARATLPPGRVLLRLSAVGGLPRSARYAVLVAARDDPAGLARALFRLVAREAEEPLPYLASREFAREVALALTFDGGLGTADLAAAVLDELGHRVTAARLLALNLLEAHAPPPQQVLRRIARETPDGPRGLDVRLLLAARAPDDGVTDEAVALAGRADVDPALKLRTLEVVVRVHDPARRARLEAALARDDPTGAVARALSRLEVLQGASGPEAGGPGGGPR